MSFEQLPKIDNQQEEETNFQESWQIISPEESVQLVQDLDIALEKGEIDRIQELLKEPKNLRSCIVHRGKGKGNIKLLEEGLVAILSKRHDFEYLTELPPSEILNELLHHAHLPNSVIAEISEIAYHLNDRALLAHILDTAEELGDDQVLAHTQHTLASWLQAKDHNTQQALKVNQQVVSISRDINDPILAAKAMVGIKLQRDAMKPQDKANDLLGLADTMFDLDHNYDALRAQEEASRVLLDIAAFHINRTDRPSKEEALDYIDQARKLALDSFKKAKIIGYPNVQVRAAQILADIYMLKYQITKNKKDLKNSDDFLRQNQQISAEYDYISTY